MDYNHRGPPKSKKMYNMINTQFLSVSLARKLCQGLYHWVGLVKGVEGSVNYIIPIGASLSAATVSPHGRAAVSQTWLTGEHSPRLYAVS